MPNEVYVRQRRVVDSDDLTAQVLVPKNTAGSETKLVWNRQGSPTFIRTRTGSRARLTFFGNAVDAGGESVVTFHVYVNGNRLPPPLDSFQFALGETFDPQSRLGYPIELPQSAIVEIAAENSSSTTDYNAFGRVRIEYEDFHE